jgi:caffeoyl-CoA O-methyltransferase
MFSEISDRMKSRMEYLEELDKKDRMDGTENMKRLRQIPPETGKFLAILASNCPEGEFIEIGTSAGYSTMWISLAAMQRKIKIKTYEILDEKVKLAKETFELSGIKDYIELNHGNALDKISGLSNIAFCFLDSEKDMYEKVFDILSDKIVRNGMLVADNAINHYEKIKPMIEKALNDKRFDSMIVPIGKGELICRRK